MKITKLHSNTDVNLVVSKLRAFAIAGQAKEPKLTDEQAEQLLSATRDFIESAPFGRSLPPRDEENWYVEISHDATKKVVQRMGPHRKHKADKIADGTSINLNHDDYSVAVVQHDTNPGRLP